MKSGEPVVRIENLTKVINNQTILDNIDFSVCQGEILGVVGKNAAGKSMLFKVMSGLVKPTKGTISVFGEIIGVNGRFAPNTGGLIEYPGLLPQYNAVKNLKQLAAIRNIVGDEEICDALTNVGLNPKDKRPVKKYSLGMRQKLGIAQAIFENPQLIILDEPTNNLDYDSVAQIQNLLLDLNTKADITIILASHNLSDIEKLCHRVLVLDQGKIVSETEVRQRA